MNILTAPWPWYVSGPLIGLMVPALLLAGNKAFGISSTLRHICAACIPGNVEFFKYNWRAESWNLLVALGMVIGGFSAGFIMADPEPVRLSADTVSDLNRLGIQSYNGLAPQDIFNWSSLLTMRGFILLVIGGFFVGFGTRYAGGCTSGHTIMGISNLQIPSVISSMCFFAGGLFMTWFILPFIMNL